MGQAQSNKNNEEENIVVKKEPFDLAAQKKRREEDPHTLTDEQFDGYYKCSCGYYLKGKHEHALHVECHLPNLKPIHPCGWPTRQLETVPYVMNTQRGVIARGHLAHSSFTSVKLRKGFDVKKVREVTSNPHLLNPHLSPDFEKDFKGEQAVTVIGYNWRTWSQISTNIPPELKPFVELNDGNGDVLFPGNTEGDLFLFVKSTRPDLAYEIANLLIQNLGEEVEEHSMTKGFAYKPFKHGAKDLTGFIDGTRNPDHLLRALVDEVVIFPDDFSNANDHVGGTFMYTGKFVHNLKKFFAMNLDQKNEIIGRDISKETPHVGYDTRLENPRLIDESETTSATGYHVARGFASMYRQAMPFRDTNEEGLFFICFSRFLSEIDTALKRMAGHFEEDRSVDKLFQITSAITSGYYYVPSLVELATLSEMEIPIFDSNKNSNNIISIDHENEVGNLNEKPLKIFFEYCTNCGYKTIFLDNKRIIEAAIPNVVIIGNPQMPRLSSFEIKTEDGFVIWSKLSQPDGRNNYPEVFPTKENILSALTDYLKLDTPLSVDLPIAKVYSDAETRVGVW